MKSDYNVGDLAAEILEAAGISTAFGVVSVHNIPLLDAIRRRNRIRFVMARGEAGAAHMADGYARVSGQIGVLISSTGPGAANSVAGLLEASTAGTPLLHLTGGTSTKFSGRAGGSVHDAPGQLAMLRSVCKAAYRLASPQQAAGLLTRGLVEALTPPCGPVTIEIPIDLQRAACSRPALVDAFRLPLAAPRVPTDFELDQLAQRVLAARRPMLWLGSGARHAAGAALQILDLGFGMVTSWAGRGVVPEDHPQNLGALNGSGSESVEKFYETVDMMLVVGSRLRGHETLDFSVRLPSRLIQIDIDPAANGRTYGIEFFVCGDSQATLEGLFHRIRGKLGVEPTFQEEFRALKKRARREYAQSLGAYAGFADKIRTVLPRDTIWARDITVANTTWGTRLFELYAPRENVYPVAAGIGQGLSLGIGAAIGAKGRKTVILTGDGGLNFNLSELWTAVQEKTDAVIVVMNDRGYGVIKHIQDATCEGRRAYWDLQGPDFAALAKLAGLAFWKVSKEDELQEAISNAIQVDGPALVEVDMNSIGEVPKYYPYGAKVRSTA